MFFMLALSLQFIMKVYMRECILSILLQLVLVTTLLGLNNIIHTHFFCKNEIGGRLPVTQSETHRLITEGILIVTVRKYLNFALS